MRASPTRPTCIDTRLACALDDAAARPGGVTWARRASERWAARLHAAMPSRTAGIVEAIADAYAYRAHAIACRMDGNIERALRFEDIADGYVADVARHASHMRDGAESPSASDRAALRRALHYRNACRDAYACTQCGAPAGVDCHGPDGKPLARIHVAYRKP